MNLPNYLTPIKGQQCITSWGVGFVMEVAESGSIRVAHAAGDPVFSRSNVELIPIGRQQMKQLSDGYIA